MRSHGLCGQDLLRATALSKGAEWRFRRLAGSAFMSAAMDREFPPRFPCAGLHSSNASSAISFNSSRGACATIATIGQSDYESEPILAALIGPMKQNLHLAGDTARSPCSRVTSMVKPSTRSPASSVRRWCQRRVYRLQRCCEVCADQCRTAPPALSMHRRARHIELGGAVFAGQIRRRLFGRARDVPGGDETLAKGQDHAAEPGAGDSAKLAGVAGQLPLKGGGIIRSASCGTSWARRNKTAAARTTANVNVMRSMLSSS